MLKIGLAILLLSLETCLWTMKNHRTYTSEPTKAPLILKINRPTQLSFVADTDFTYNIEVSLEQIKDFDDLAPAFARLSDTDALAIQVEDNGQFIDLQCGTGEHYSDISYVVPASFQTQAGHCYNITIVPKKTFSDLQAMKPMARIGIDNASIVWETIREVFTGLLAISLFLLGIGLTLAGRRPRR